MSLSVAVSPASRTGFIVTFATLANALVTSHTTTAPSTRPAVSLESLDGEKGFGHELVADGSTVVAFDSVCGIGRPRRGRRCEAVLRVFEGPREVFQRFAKSWSDAWALRGDTLVLRARNWNGGDRSGHLELVTRTDGAWSDQPSVPIEDSCSGENYHRQMALGTTVLVLEARERLCIYERAGATWRLSVALNTKQPRFNGLAMAGDRVVTLLDDHVEVHERAEGSSEWTRRFIVTPRLAALSGFATSSRWVVVRATLRGDETPVLLVFDAASGEWIDTLASQFDDVVFASTGFEVTDTTIATISRVDQAWSYIDGAWQPRGALTPATDVPAADSPRGLGIGDDVIWVGEPIYGRASHGGTIEGFQISDTAP